MNQKQFDEMMELSLKACDASDALEAIQGAPIGKFLNWELAKKLAEASYHVAWERLYAACAKCDHVMPDGCAAPKGHYCGICDVVLK